MKFYFTEVDNMIFGLNTITFEKSLIFLYKDSNKSTYDY